MQPQMRGLIRKSVIFFENIDLQSSPAVRLCDPARNGEFGRFGIFTDRRPIRLGGRASDLRKFMISSGNMVYNCPP
jgi:hypothetical protein